jgi:hypothetical protein
MNKIGLVKGLSIALAMLAMGVLVVYGLITLFAMYS